MRLPAMKINAPLTYPPGTAWNGWFDTVAQTVMTQKPLGEQEKRSCDDTQLVPASAGHHPHRVRLRMLHDQKNVNTVLL